MQKKLKKSVYQTYHHLTVEEKLTLEAIFLVIMVICGAVMFHYTEWWRYLDAVYFTTSTLATVGYGDFVPKTDIWKIFTMTYQLIGIPIFLYTGSLLIERRISSGIHAMEIKSIE